MLLEDQAAVALAQVPLERPWEDRLAICWVRVSMCCVVLAEFPDSARISCSCWQRSVPWLDRACCVFDGSIVV